MKLSGQLECFCSDIEKLVARYQEEFDLEARRHYLWRQ